MSASNHENRVVSRRQVLRIVAVGGIAAGTAWKFATSRPAPASAVTETRSLMGTTVNLTVLGPDERASRAAVEATLARMESLEGALSRYRDDSQVGRLNRDGAIDDAGEDLLALLELGRELHARSDGAFDVTVQPLLDLYRAGGALPDDAAIAACLPRVDASAVRVEGSRVRFDRPGMKITLDGIGKGYIVDRAVDELRGRGFENVLVEAGGDLVASGTKAGDRPWRLGIRRPRSGMKKMLLVDARDRAIATSGDYMQPFTPDYRLHHILDPRTGVSANELASSTVLAPNAALADGLATLTMVAGARRASAILEAMDGCEGCFIGKDLTVTKTPGFRTL